MSRLKLNRDSGFSSKIGTISPNSRRLDTLQGLLGGPGEKTRNLRSSNCRKCIKIVNPSITTLFLYHFKYLRSHQADLFGSWGEGGCVRTPQPPPPACLRTCEFYQKCIISKDYSYWEFWYLKRFDLSGLLK